MLTCATDRAWDLPRCVTNMLSDASPDRTRSAYETIPDVKPLAGESPFLLACRRKPVPYTPVWYMRQGGRSLPEYRAARAGMGMLEACSRPDVIVEITLQPLRRYAVDAAILFSDIVVPLKAIGVGLDIRPGVGPVLERPLRDARDVE